MADAVALDESLDESITYDVAGKRLGPAGDGGGASHHYTMALGKEARANRGDYDIASPNKFADPEAAGCGNSDYDIASPKNFADPEATGGVDPDYDIASPKNFEDPEAKGGVDPDYDIASPKNFALLQSDNSTIEKTKDEEDEDGKILSLASVAPFAATISNFSPQALNANAEPP
jgi:hypothetical protein